jgi:hypothetical protein
LAIFPEFAAKWLEKWHQPIETSPAFVGFGAQFSCVILWQSSTNPSDSSRLLELFGNAHCDILEATLILLFARFAQFAVTRPTLTQLAKLTVLTARHGFDCVKLVDNLLTFCSLDNFRFNFFLPF